MVIKKRAGSIGCISSSLLNGDDHPCAQSEYHLKQQQSVNERFRPWMKGLPTVSAWVGSSLVEVDVDLGVTESAASAIAHSNALRDKVNRFLFDELDGCHGVRLL
jgi:hypothetical protein